VFLLNHVIGRLLKTAEVGMKPLIAAILLSAVPLVLVAGDHPLADGPAEVDDVQRIARPSQYAGLDEPADDLDAERLRRQNLEILSEKLERRSQLNAEIAELERTLDVANQYVVRCHIVEMPFETFEAVSQDSSGEINAEVYRRILALPPESKIKTLADQSLSVFAGRPATSTSGGEVPLPTSQGQGSKPEDVKKQFVGFRLDAVLEELGKGRLRLQCAAETAELRRIGNKNQDEPGGIPFVDRGRMTTTIELAEGETVNLGATRIMTTSSQPQETSAFSWLRKRTSRKTSLSGDAAAQNDQITLFLVTVERQTRGESDVAAR
jgi:Flp pilus assembly secretin CpaC